MIVYYFPLPAGYMVTGPVLSQLDDTLLGKVYTFYKAGNVYKYDFNETQLRFVTAWKNF